MKTIWKFPINITDGQELSIPEGGKILCVQTQAEIPCIWVLVDPKNKKIKRKIFVYGTGHPVDNDNINYIGTFQTGPLVFHVFEEFI